MFFVQIPIVVSVILEIIVINVVVLMRRIMVTMTVATTPTTEVIRSVALYGAKAATL